MAFAHLNASFLVLIASMNLVLGALLCKQLSMSILSTRAGPPFTMASSAKAHARGWYLSGSQCPACK